MTDQQPAAPKTATEAQAVLDTRSADKDWGTKLLAGDQAARREFDDLTALASAGDSDKVAIAMSGVLPARADGEMREMAGTAEMLREIGLRDDVIRETLAGGKVTQAEFDATKAWHSSHMNDREFVKKWLAGDVEARRQMTLAHIILSSDIKVAA